MSGLKLRVVLFCGDVRCIAPGVRIYGISRRWKWGVGVYHVLLGKKIVSISLMLPIQGINLI